MEVSTCLLYLLGVRQKNASGQQMPHHIYCKGDLTEEGFSQIEGLHLKKMDSGGAGWCNYQNKSSKNGERRDACLWILRSYLRKDPREKRKLERKKNAVIASMMAHQILRQTGNKRMLLGKTRQLVELQSLMSMENS